jgi:DNA polymerase-3 subunit gamma/tau
LELGLLKLVHAQRLLPLEQLLSGATQAGAAPAETLATSRPTVAPATKQANALPASNPFARPEAARPSPFEADRARKTRTAENLGPARENGAAPPVETGGANAAGVVAAMEAAPEHPDIDAVRDQVLTSLQRGDQKSLAGLLENGEWRIASNVVQVKPEDAQSVMNLLRIFASAQQALDRAASTALGRPAKIQILPSAAENGAIPDRVLSSKPAAPKGSARSRAAEDPIVKRVQEKFGAEIRTVIDQRNRE